MLNGFQKAFSGQILRQVNFIQILTIAIAHQLTDHPGDTMIQGGFEPTDWC